MSAFASVSLLILLAAMISGATSAVAATLEIRLRFEHYARRAELRRRMRQLEDHESDSGTVRGVEITPRAQPASLRTLTMVIRLSHEKPLNRAVDSILERVHTDMGLGSPNTFSNPTDKTVTELLDQADLRRTFAPSDIDRAQIAGAMLGGAIGFVVLFTLVSLFAGLVGAVAGVYLGFRFPIKTLAKAATQRVERCVAQLPHMIEVISLGSTAGASFVSSIDLYCTRFEGPLPQEMSMVAAAWKTGAQSWEQALAEFARRLDAVPITHFVSTVTQALKLGAPMAQMLETQSAEARRSKRAQIEEKIEKAPVKMLLPMGTLVLPAMLLLILGPVLLGMST